MIPTPAKMNEHVRSLCAQNEIIVSECQHASQALALRECSQAIIPPVRSANSYAVALHEIGHLLGRYQQSKSTMVREKWAWQWARENARVWTSGMEQFAKGSLAWYLHRHSTRGENLISLGADRRDPISRTLGNFIKPLSQRGKGVRSLIRVLCCERALKARRQVAQLQGNQIRVSLRKFRQIAQVSASICNALEARALCLCRISSAF